ncbi:hypothetical protein P3646_06790 [Vibrio parahaemolyticus]|nr:hypothetical protein [Vibrio parahaemolyticus]
MEHRGNGYSGYSKSNNAIFAEEENKFPISEISKRTKLATDTIRYFFEPCEWHHTSKLYNKTDYYDYNEIVENIDDEVLAYDKELKAKKRSQRKNTQLHKGCDVDWVEWRGNGRSKRRVERSEENCTILVSGNKHTITTPSGEVVVKMGHANGFMFRTGEELRKAKRERRQEQAQINKNLKSLFSDQSKYFYILDYRSFNRNENDEIVLDDFEPQEPKRITKKAFTELVKSELACYGLRTLDECAKHGYSRLGCKYFVIHSENPQEVLNNLLIKSKKYIDSFLPNGLESSGLRVDTSGYRVDTSGDKLSDKKIFQTYQLKNEPSKKFIAEVNYFGDSISIINEKHFNDFAKNHCGTKPISEFKESVKEKLKEHTERNFYANSTTLYLEEEKRKKQKQELTKDVEQKQKNRSKLRN